MVRKHTLPCATCIYFEFWLATWIGCDCFLYDWLSWLLRLWFQSFGQTIAASLNATYPNIAGSEFASSGQTVATCCGLKIEQVRMPGGNTIAMTWPNDYNIMHNRQTLHDIFGHFQIWANTTQHVATGWSNTCNMLRSIMFRYVVLKCCDRLAGA